MKPRTCWTARYEEYLESVMESTDQFHEIGDIITRFTTLQATNADLKQQQQQITDAAEQRRCASWFFLFCPAPLGLHLLGHVQVQKQQQHITDSAKHRR
jgi:hypothetical protein